jgi:hypothetical protein
MSPGNVVDGDDGSLRLKPICQYVEKKKVRMAVQVEEKSPRRKETLFCPRGSREKSCSSI